MGGRIGRLLSRKRGRVSLSYATPQNRVTWSITTRKLSCSRIYRKSCIQFGQDSPKAEKDAYGNHKVDSSPDHTKAASGSFLKEVRCAVRFPLSLPVELSDQLRELPGVTRNVSSNGVLFEVERATECRRRHPLLIENARKCTGYSPGCVSSLSRACGTLLLKPKSLSGCRHDR